MHTKNSKKYYIHLVEKITEKMKDGVLEIRIPKTAESSGKQITIDG